MAGVRKISISELGPGIGNAMLIAVIIAKQTPRKITSKKNPGTERAVWSFTLRDTPYDFINASYWGSVENVNSIASGLHIGDVVEVMNVKVNMRQGNDSEERFQPCVTSPFQLILSENQSTVQLQRPVDEFDADMYNNLIHLLHIPTKAPSSFITIADILASETSTRTEFVDLLVAVARVSPVKNIKTKDGRDIECREVTVLDQTNSNFPIQLWEPDVIVQSGHWKPRHTVLFLADVRLAWNNFHRSMGVSICSRTIITENPDTTEANVLREYAFSAPIAPSAVLDQMANSISDASAIRVVMSVQQVIKKASRNMVAEENFHRNSEDSQFSCLIYCFVTDLDLDGVSRVVVTRCSKCQATMEDTFQGMCPNIDCPVGSGAVIAKPEITFDIRVTLSDHTGSLPGCRLMDKNAEKVLGCTPTGFQHLTPEEKTSLKWNLLLERCAARVMVLKANSQRQVPLISLLSCDPADPSEVAARCPRC
ncbi:meiosis-specific with OB domain-containing protein [Ischnura elegans]|uniref:meiosis-specific with OB domain-containing protein n=1 Tax=Ischnura elegans TaxID=197161 RepID=UPI001ED894A9|nr:meiosis-specific with OB domain-containing protein [Ischnura elegans]XP_046398311.1 meiosis-specific with OB domain-containing protein [Ischnura elegans]